MIVMYYLFLIIRRRSNSRLKQQACHVTTRQIFNVFEGPKSKNKINQVQKKYYTKAKWWEVNSSDMNDSSHDFGFWLSLQKSMHTIFFPKRPYKLLP